MIDYAEWCSLCQSRPADGQIEGYFTGLPEEMMTLMVCGVCAAKAMSEVDIEGIRQ